MIQFVDKYIGAGKLSGLLHIGIYSYGGKIGGNDLNIAVNLYVSETKDSKARLVMIRTAAAGETDLLQWGQGGCTGSFSGKELYHHGHLVVSFVGNTFLNIAEVHVTFCIQNLSAEQP